MVNTEALLDRVLVARPKATADDVRRLAPVLADLPDGEIDARLQRARRRRSGGRSRASG